MVEFSYKGLNGAGDLVEGDLLALGREQALGRLDDLGITPVSVELKTEIQNSKTGWNQWFKAKSQVSGNGEIGKVNFRQLETFTRQLSALLNAGVPLAKGLHHLAEETSAPNAKAQWWAIHDLVVEGHSLADAMQQFPACFGTVYCAMVRAGEAGGFIAPVLSQIAEFQANEKEMRGKMVSALIYPMVLAVLAIAVVIFLLIFFIPKFETMFADLGANLPILTQWVMKLSEFMTTQGGWIVLILGGFGYYLHRWKKSEKGGRQWEAALLKFPIFGALNARFAMVRFCRMLGTLTAAGVPLLQALKVARESLGNRVLVDAVTHSLKEVQQGNRLSDSLGSCPELFPRSVTEIVSVAEQSGRLDEELIRLAETTEKDLDRQLKNALAMAEPALLFVMAVVIGVIVVAMVLPIFEIQDHIN